MGVKKAKKQKMRTLLCIILILAGLLLAFYPVISNYLFENRADSLITTYEKEVEETDDEIKQQMLLEAQEYNRILYENPVDISDPFSNSKENSDNGYRSILNLDENGMMGFVEIPKINVRLPIYHGTSNEVLQKGIGHLMGSSFPVGGENTHAVLTGHTGLRSAKMFTDLTEIDKGDLFFINVLDEKLAYKVTAINVVKPDDISLLSIQEGKDMVTLITCTPYGVNSHRLLVTGERTPYSEELYHAEEEKEYEDSTWRETFKDAVFFGVLVSLLLYLTDQIQKKRKRIRRHKKVLRFAKEQKNQK